MEKQMDIVVIGAGLTGLSTAHFLNKKKQSFIVLEQSDRIGGAIQTGQEAGFIYEKGPSTGVMNNEIVKEIFDDVHSYCSLEWASNEVNKRFILKNNQWHTLPDGILSGITTPLFRWSDKIRLLGEPFRKAGKNPNETLTQLVARRMGKSFLDYAVDPFVSGVYAGDTDYLVPRFALPKLYNLEQKYGSFIGGSVKMQLEKRKSKMPKTPKQPHRIFSVKGGLNHLTHALMKSAGEEHFLLGVQNLRIVPASNHQFEITGQTSQGEQIHITAHHVITTTGASSLDSLLPFVEKHLMAKITNIAYAKVVQVAVGFTHWDYKPLEGFGGLIPSKEKKQILGVLYPSAFLSDRAPKGGALLSVFLGGTRHPEVYDMDDETIFQLLESSLKEWFNMASFHPSLFRIFRYHEAIPQYGADCEARFMVLDRLHEQYPTLHIGGNLRGGIGMADRMKQGKQLADEANS